MTVGSQVVTDWFTLNPSAATVHEVKVMAYLLVAAPSTNETNLMLWAQNVSCEMGAMPDYLVAQSKSWLNESGAMSVCLGPVQAVMLEHQNVSTTQIDIYKWRTKLTAPATDKYQLKDLVERGRKKVVTRLRSMFKRVAVFLNSCTFQALKNQLRVSPAAAAMRSPSKAELRGQLSERSSEVRVRVVVPGVCAFACLRGAAVEPC